MRGAARWLSRAWWRGSGRRTVRFSRGAACDDAEEGGRREEGTREGDEGVVGAGGGGRCLAVGGWGGGGGAVVVGVGGVRWAPSVQLTGGRGGRVIVC